MLTRFCHLPQSIPGFAVDEPVATLGRDLKLPGFLEPHRKQIEGVLPSLEESVA